MKKYVWIFISCCLFVILTGCVGYNENDMRSVIGKGDLLVFAINDFRVKEGTLPESLENLLPNYLEELPSFKFGGRNFYYRTYTIEDGATEFSLSCILRPGGFSLLAAHAVERLKYDPRRDVCDSPTTEVLGRRGDWVLILSKKEVGRSRTIRERTEAAKRLGK